MSRVRNGEGTGHGRPPSPPRRASPSTSTCCSRPTSSTTSSPAGARIVIESVAIRLGVSPTPVREALARFAGEQLVSFRAYVGYSALPPLSPTELLDLFEAREVIECAGAVRACERATDADLERLREIDAHIRAGHYGKERYSEFVSFVNDNQRFHETLLDAARNPELRRALDALNYEARIARRTRGRGVPDLGLICEEHAAIIAALTARDAQDTGSPPSPIMRARATSAWSTTSRASRRFLGPPLLLDRATRRPRPRVRGGSCASARSRRRA